MSPGVIGLVMQAAEGRRDTSTCRSRFDTIDTRTAYEPTNLRHLNRNHHCRNCARRAFQRPAPSAHGTHCRHTGSTPRVCRLQGRIRQVDQNDKRRTEIRDIATKSICISSARRRRQGKRHHGGGGSLVDFRWSFTDHCHKRKSKRWLGDTRSKGESAAFCAATERHDDQSGLVQRDPGMSNGTLRERVRYRERETHRTLRTAAEVRTDSTSKCAKLALWDEESQHLVSFHEGARMI